MGELFPTLTKVVKLGPSASDIPSGQVLTLDTSAYAANDALHTGYLTLNVVNDGGRQVKLTKVLNVDKAAQNPNFRIYFFDRPPTASTITANAAFVLHDSDAFKLVGVVDIAAGTSITTIAFKETDFNPPVPIKPFSGKYLYAVLVLLAGTPTFGADDMQVILHFEKA